MSLALSLYLSLVLVELGCWSREFDVKYGRKVFYCYFRFKANCNEMLLWLNLL